MTKKDIKQCNVYVATICLCKVFLCKVFFFKVNFNFSVTLSETPTINAFL